MIECNLHLSVDNNFSRTDVSEARGFLQHHRRSSMWQALSEILLWQPARAACPTDRDLESRPFQPGGQSRFPPCITHPPWRCVTMCFADKPTIQWWNEAGRALGRGGSVGVQRRVPIAISSCGIRVERAPPRATGIPHGARAPHLLQLAMCWNKA